MSEQTASLIAAYFAYRDARVRLLRELECLASNRDPIAEFSERLLVRLLGGELARSRVQAGYDLVTRLGQRVQVKYLANPSAGWVNEHHVQFSHPDCDAYALVFFEDLLPVAAILFPRERIGEVCAALQKRHPNQDSGLQLTRRNFRQILDQQSTFEALGVRVFRLEEGPVTL